MINDNKIIEYRDTRRLSYLLQSPDLFYQIGYKVLKSQENNDFIKCNRIIYNGMDKLVYDISAYKSLDLLLPEISEDIALAIIMNMIDIIVDVKGNGFMNCDNIEVNFEKVFVDVNNYKVFFVYLPIESNDSQYSYNIFESKFKAKIVNNISGYKHLQGIVQSAFFEALKNKDYTLDAISDTFDVKNYNKKRVKQTGRSSTNNIFSSLFKKKETTVAAINEPIQKKQLFINEGTVAVDNVYRPEIVLSGLKTPEKAELVISKEEFVIGKKAELVDGVIGFNNAISRVHCKIQFFEGNYYIIDLGSANGTYINGRKIVSNQQCLIQVGDKIMLANSEFLVKTL